MILMLLVLQGWNECCAIFPVHKSTSEPVKNIGCEVTNFVGRSCSFYSKKTFSGNNFEL